MNEGPVVVEEERNKDNTKLEELQAEVDAALEDIREMEKAIKMEAEIKAIPGDILGGQDSGMDEA